MTNRRAACCCGPRLPCPPCCPPCRRHPAPTPTLNPSQPAAQGLESLLASPAGAQPGLRRSASARRADENASPTRGPFLLGGSPGSPPQRKALAESVAARSGVFAGLSAAVGAAAAGGTLPDSVTFPPPHQRSVSVGGGAGGGGAFDGAW